MDVFQIANLRLGFGVQPTEKYKNISAYASFLLNHPEKVKLPDFLNQEDEVFADKKLRKTLSDPQKKEMQKDDRKRFRQLQLWWLNRIYTSPNPLQEKMVFFWHNHFVSSYQKVKQSTFIFYQNNLYRDYAFGNFKELTKEVLYDNAMIDYLDNQQNKVSAPNENLSRELLELFTLGIGNYTEKDISEGARALAGLSEHTNRGEYNQRKEDNGIKTYLGKTGNLKAEDLVDAIFAHPKITYRIMEKFLKFFLTDSPSEALIQEYAEYFKKSKFEIKPVINKLFTDTDFTKYNGAKIKNPLEFLMQTFHQVNYKTVPAKASLQFLKNQGMDILNPPNVKGWDGGHAWLDSGKLIARNSAIDTVFNNRFVKKQQQQMMSVMMDDADPDDNPKDDFMVSIKWNREIHSNLEVIRELSEQLIFETGTETQKNMEKIVRHDFDASAPNANDDIQQLVRYLMKTPQYQIL